MGHDLIVPGTGIGLFRLGMSQREVTAAGRAAPCPVFALFAQGRATRLETNCGGAYRTADHITVGWNPYLIWWVYGEPDRVDRSDFAGVRGDWVRYTAYGIAFRLVYAYGPGNALIQAIAVFKGTRPVPVRSPAPLPAPAPPPGVGD